MSQTQSQLSRLKSIRRASAAAADLCESFPIPTRGKTTLTEHLLLLGGAIHAAGRVKARGEARRAKSDWMKNRTGARHLGHQCGDDF